MADTNGSGFPLTRVIEQLLAPYEEQLQQAESMPGWGRRTAQDALAETGPDMTRFPTPATRPRRLGPSSLLVLGSVAYLG
jgi:hypothetical protein